MSQKSAGAGLLPRPAAMDERKLCILVADDSKSQLTTLSFFLRTLGHDVHCASDGHEALSIADTVDVNLVISDWMMPRMSGLDLCEAIRAREDRPYVYFILLTSKADTAAISAGFASGVDDYLSKPVVHDELKARIGSGVRILELYGQLREQRHEVELAYGELKTMHDAVNRDLQAAAKLQQSFIPSEESTCLGASIATHYRPANHIGGDLVGHFQGDDRILVAYSIDVSGHGISSALLCVQLAQMFDPNNPDRNVCFEDDSNGAWRLRRVHEIAQELNDRHQTGVDCDLYFTMGLAFIDVVTGHVEMTQCGHPAALVQRRNGQVEFMGDGGSPIGLVPFASYEILSFSLAPGDRLFLYSDGLSECENVDGEQFDDTGLERFFRSRDDERPLFSLKHLMAELDRFRQNCPFSDDVSSMLIELAPEDRCNLPLKCKQAA
ncbi:MAG: SpoIIE family protein phosphatase [Pseudomonadota bacterium]